MEEEWPAFREDQELGSIPGFLWRDRGPHLLSEDATADALFRDGVEWRRRYDEAAQHRMARVQEHIHKKKDGRRVPLAACLSVSSERRCKHDFPMGQRLTERALVVCPGIAKAHG